MSIHEEMIQRMLKDLNDGIRMPVKDKAGNWGEKILDYQTILKGYCTNTVPRNIWLSKYETIEPIENIPAEEKKEWKKFVNEVFPDGSKEFRLEAVKIIYTIAVMSS